MELALFSPRSRTARNRRRGIDLACATEGEFTNPYLPARGALRWPARPLTNPTGIVVSGVIAAASTIMAITSNGMAVFIIAAAAAAVFCAGCGYKKWTFMRQHQAQADQRADHHEVFGPDRIAISGFIDPWMAHQARQIAAIWQRLTQSEAIRSGALGDTDDVALYIDQHIWDSLLTVRTLDRTIVRRQAVNLAIDRNGVSADAVRGDDRDLDARIAQSRTILDAQVAQLGALADDVHILDGRRATPAARAALLRLATPASLSQDSSLTQLTARITAAHDVLDAGGHTPSALP